MKNIFSTKPLYEPTRIITGLVEGVHMPTDTQYVRQIDDTAIDKAFEHAIRYGFSMFSVKVIDPRSVMKTPIPAPASYTHPFLNTDTEN